MFVTEKLGSLGLLKIWQINSVEITLKNHIYQVKINGEIKVKMRTYGSKKRVEIDKVKYAYTMS